MYRCSIRPFLICLLFAVSVISSGQAASQSRDYEIGTLFSTERANVPKRSLSLEKPADVPAIPADRLPGAVRSSDRLPWEQRIPWWREEAIERGRLAPYEQESTFRRSLEAGRAYPEASGFPRGRRSDDTVSAVAPRVTVSGSTGPLVLAAFWQGARDTVRKQAGLEIDAAAAAAAPISANEAETVRYRGILLMRPAGIDKETAHFFSILKKAIDLVAELPVALKRYGTLIDTVVYDPPLPERKVLGPLVDADAAYTITELNRKGRLLLYRDLRNSSPLEVAMSLIGGGVLAARHQRLIDLLDIHTLPKPKAKDRPATRKRKIEKELADRMTLVRHSDDALLNMAECDLHYVLLQAEYAFGVRKSKISRRLQILDQRNCWAPKPTGQ